MARPAAPDADARARPAIKEERMRRITALSVIACTLMFTAVARASTPAGGHGPASAPHRVARLLPRAVSPFMVRAVRRSDTVLRRTRRPPEGRISAGQAEAFAFRARGSGRVGAIDVHLGARDEAARVLVALFSDRGGRPGAVMAAGSISDPRAGAWNAIAVTGAAVDSGRRYWVALLGQGGAVSFRAGGRRAMTAGSASRPRRRRQIAVAACSDAADDACAPLVYLTITPTMRAKHEAPTTGTTAPATGASSPTTGTTAPTPTTGTGTTTRSPGATTPTVRTTVSTPTVAPGPVLAPDPVTAPPVTPPDPGSPTTTVPAPPSTPPDDCDLSATPASFTSQVSAAKAGQTLCLADGSYGTWKGVNKAIVVAAAPGATPTIGLNFATSASGFTLDGLTVDGGNIDSGAHDITIEDSAFTDSLTLDDLANASITLNGDSFDNLNDNASCTGEPARIHLDYYSTTPSGVTVENSEFVGGNEDGIQTAAPLTIRDNLFENVAEKSASDCQHTDSIQGVGATGVVVVGNLFDNDSDGFVDFDDSTTDTATDNACYAIYRGACITLYGDRGSVVEHNTAGPGMNVLEIDTKSGNRAGTGTIFEDNVGGYSETDGSTLGADDGNLFPGARSPDVNGAPTFAGGADPTTWTGFELAGTSVGRAADDGGDTMGIQPSVGGPPNQ